MFEVLCLRGCWEERNWRLGGVERAKAVEEVEAETELHGGAEGNE